MRRGTRRGLVQAQNRVGIVLLTLTVLALAIGFAAGIATTQAMSESQNQALAGSLSSDLAAFGRAAPDFGATFRQSLWQNVKCFALIALLGMSVAGIPFALLTVGFRGFLLGFPLGFLVGHWGLKGLLLFFTSVLPQNLLSLPALCFAAVVAMMHALERFALRRYPRTAQEHLLAAVPMFTRVGLALLIAVGASLLEALLAPPLVKMISGML